MAFDTNVVFSPGAPLDVNKLNQLQANIRSVYDETRSLNTTTEKVGGLEKTVKTIPIVDVGTVTVKVNGNTTPVIFNNTGFDANPVIVATIQDDLKPNTSYSIRAKTTSLRGANIEVTSTDTSANETINVNYIAIQMKAQS